MLVLLIRWFGVSSNNQNPHPSDGIAQNDTAVGNKIKEILVIINMSNKDKYT